METFALYNQLFKQEEQLGRDRIGKSKILEILDDWEDIELCYETKPLYLEKDAILFSCRLKNNTRAALDSSFWKIEFVWNTCKSVRCLQLMVSESAQFDIILDVYAPRLDAYLIYCNWKKPIKSIELSSFVYCMESLIPSCVSLAPRKLYYSLGSKCIDLYSPTVIQCSKTFDSLDGLLPYVGYHENILAFRWMSNGSILIMNHSETCRISIHCCDNITADIFWHIIRDIYNSIRKLDTDCTLDSNLCFLLNQEYTL